MSAAPVTRQTLREQVLRILREEILTGVFEPGERLSEPELAKRLDVSLTPVREALGDLAASGLVVRNGRQGTHVRRIGVRDAVNLSSLGVGLLTAVVLLFLTDHLDEPWMFLGIPAVTALSFWVAHWVTTSQVDDADLGPPLQSERHDVR